MVMMAMCADAADEMLLLIRAHDNESADVATITQKVAECVTNPGGARWGMASPKPWSLEKHQKTGRQRVF